MSEFKVNDTCLTCGKPIDNGFSSRAYCSWQCTYVALAKLFDPTRGQKPMETPAPQAKRLSEDRLAYLKSSRTEPEHE